MIVFKNIYSKLKYKKEAIKKFQAIKKINYIDSSYLKYPKKIEFIMSQPKKKIALINAKLNFGQGKRGTELGPDHIKQEFLFTNLENLNYDAFDYANLEDVIVDDEIKYLRNRNIYSLGQTNQKLSKAVTQAIEHDCTPVILGGDHSLAIGSVHGTCTAMKKTSEIGLIWIDAHADINTPLTTASGNLHGQPVSFLLEELDEYLPKLRGFEWIKPCLPARNLVYIGLRDLDPEETIIIQKNEIKAYSMSDVQRLGIQQVMKETLEYLTIDGKLLPLHCSVDIDSLDPWYAPCTGTPVLGGLTLTELMYIGNTIHETGNLKTLDLVEVNPLIKSNDNDAVQKTVFSAIRSILSFFGYKTLGTVQPFTVLPKPCKKS